MKITPDEARQSLDAIDRAVRTTQQTMCRQGARIMAAWGVAYLLGPLCMHFWPLGGLIPQQLLLIGAIAFTIYDVSRHSLVSGRSSWRFGAMWGITFGFGYVWLLILAPFDWSEMQTDGPAISRQMWAYGVTLAMFVYVLMGLWESRLFWIVGLFITACTLFGVLFLDQWYWLWCGVTGGGALLSASLYLHWKSKSE